MIWPGTPADYVQIIDVRDFASFTIDCLEQRIAGTYNTVTPKGSYTMGDLHDDCLAVTAADMNAVWVSSDFLNDQKLLEGREIPIWAQPGGEYAAVAKINGEKAAAAGLTNRPVRETARDTVAWWKTLPGERTSKPRAGLAAEREADVLQLWKARSG
jgi:2'-hydroxyisoflavone reductase